MKILIDNGHGIETPGKRSPDGVLREYTWNRLIASRIVDRLLSLGLDAELLVPEERDISLPERCHRVNAWCRRLGKDNVILISIHANAAAQASLPGQRLRTDYTDGDPDMEADFYILRHTTAPAVLTENFFMDSHPDCAFLLSEEGQQSLVDLHVDGICAYLAIPDDNLLNHVSQETFSRK